jgi:homoserine kinase type II
MAVYTEVSDEDLVTFLSAYEVGALLSFKGIAEGVENSNYLVLTEVGSYILTLYERRVAEHDLPFFLGLLDYLAHRGVACPQPIKGRDGLALRHLCGRPAALTSFLTGVWPRRTLAWHCEALGGALAAMHQAGEGYGLKRPNALSVAGWRTIFESCKAGVDSVLPGLAAEIESDLGHFERVWPKALPAGVIHADLFPDNVFFHHDRLSGLIDFYFACNDFFAYDLAICLNAWCFESDGSLNVTKARALTNAYVRRRPLTLEERAAMPLLARGAALRFLVTRLFDWLNQVDGALVKPKDPLEYVRRLRFHRGVVDAAAYGMD